MHDAFLNVKQNMVSTFDPCLFAEAKVLDFLLLLGILDSLFSSLEM
jgi:hypothetical protein